jgi:hypothetical protein
MNQTQQQLLAAIAEMSELHPDWRFGQMIANLTDWARQPADPAQAATAAWDVEDQELLETIQGYLERRRAPLEHEPTSI